MSADDSHFHRKINKGSKKTWLRVGDKSAFVALNIQEDSVMDVFS